MFKEIGVFKLDEKARVRKSHAACFYLCFEYRKKIDMKVEERLLGGREGVEGEGGEVGGARRDDDEEQI